MLICGGVGMGRLGDVKSGVLAGLVNGLVLWKNTAWVALLPVVAPIGATG